VRLGRALALIALLPGLASAGVRPRYGGELRALLPSAPLGLDPSRALSPVDLQMAAVAHATLLDLDPSGALRPALLEALPEPEDGGRAWRLRLAPGLIFQDGQPITAADVAASLARLSAPGSLYAWLASPIEGSADVRGGRAARLAGVQVLGERELRVALRYPFPDFPQALAALPAAIVRTGPQGALVGAGPFRPAGALAATSRMEAFDGFVGGRPFADAVVLAGAETAAAARALRAGTAELALRAEAIEPRRDGLRSVETPRLGLAIAVVSPRLGDAAAPIRAALAALDRADLARFAHAPATPLRALLPALPGRAPGPAPAAPPARRLRLAFAETPFTPRAAAERLQVKLYDRGVHVALERQPAAALAARLASGDFDVALVPVWLVARAPALALGQIAAAAGGPERGAQALARLAPLSLAWPPPPSLAQPVPASNDALAAAAASLEDELLAVPLYAAGLRVALRPGVEGVEVRSDGTLELGGAWLAPEVARTAPGAGAPP
jgi:peptide/nickel transport system substrate-binding protein